MSAWELPTALTVGGQSWKIRSDYRAILDILSFFNNPEYENDEKQLICLDILYVDFCNMPEHLYLDAAKAAAEFIDAGLPRSNKEHPKLMDWEKDAPIIIPSINSSLRMDVRAIPDFHWWTFLSFYMSIQDGLFAQVLSIRTKIQEGKRLEKYEAKFYRNNRALIDFESVGNDESDEIFWEDLLRKAGKRES